MLSDGAVSRLRDAVEEPDLSGTKYRLKRLLGRGGMGAVWLVEDSELGREVALKVLSLPTGTGSLPERLLREARLLASLEHPNIVPIHEAGTLADGRLYYAMKYVRGERLDAWRAKALPPARLRLFQRLCEAAAFAHARGVVHRDLKPENVMVGAFGEALVMDWGVAKILDGSGAGVHPREAEAEAMPTLAPDARIRAGAPGGTEEGSLIGTPAYMAPEQAEGRIGVIDARTDVYALGAILYFLLTGRAPFDGGAAADLLRRVRVESPEPPRRIDSSAPRQLESICLKAMSRDPAARYATALELSEDTGRFLDGLPVSAHRETFVEKASRVIGRNRVLVLLILTYLAARAVLLLVFGN